MKTKLKTKLMSLLLAVLLLLPTMMPVIGIFAEEDITTYVLEANELSTFAAGKPDGTTEVAGTDRFFTLHYSAKSKVDTSKNKVWDDGYGNPDPEVSVHRINLQGKMSVGEVIKNCISFKTQGAATVKIWWVSGGSGREFGILDENGDLVTQTNDSPAESNILFISEMTIPSEGQYYLGGLEGNNYIFKVEVTTKTLDKGPRADWSTVEAPTISSVTTNAAGKVEVNANGFVDHHGADYLEFRLLDKDGKVISYVRSNSAETQHARTFSPYESGDYSVQVALVREGEAEKASEVLPYSFVLPLGTPYITNVNNLGGGSVHIVWNPVLEAETYEITVNDGEPFTTEARDLTLEGLSLGENTIQITAIRGSESVAANPKTFTVTEAAQIGWNYTLYGPGAKPANNSCTVNKDGTVTIKSENNGGKLQPQSYNGLGFYYTAVPSDVNFTFRGTIHVDSWVFTNGQEGFGLMVSDHVPSFDYDSSETFLTNSYQAVSTKIEYKYLVDEEGNYYMNTTASPVGTKYTMKLGIGTISKTGVTPDALNKQALLGDNEQIIFGGNGYLKTVLQSFERSAGFCNLDAGTYNIIGNWQGDTPEGTLDEEYIITDITFEITKNNTGYFITYFGREGEVLLKNYYDCEEGKDYTDYENVSDYDPLAQFDSDYVYIGMFAARYATVTFSDFTLTLRDKEEDPEPEERPIEYITPTITVTSSNNISTPNYELVADSNVDGWIEVKVNNRVILENQPIRKYERFTKIFDLSEIISLGENAIIVSFKADPDQELEQFTKLEKLDAEAYEDVLTYFKGSYHTKTIYVSPTGVYNGNGTREHPYDLYTAVNCVIPGQTIVLMEGTYILKQGLRIQRGMNGTQENPIRLIADPEAETRPVLDFNNEGTGITHGGNWWYFYGFDVTNTSVQLASKGFQISGNNNVVENVHAYKNGNTGIQISRYHTADMYKEQWPANNLILNCESWGNADQGGEDADGFAAKLTIGEGNVFDGCVAHHNADDGWDLFAKVATGPIGSVTIKNCVAYSNGYRLDGGKEGNGNGFKLGGDNLKGAHKLINCVAFYNKQKGIDSNSCPDIYVENCTSYNNGSYNVAFYTKNQSTDFTGKGIISFKDENVVNVHPGSDDKFLYPKGVKVGDELKPYGTQTESKIYNDSCYYMYTDDFKSVNTSGVEITADMFKSLEFTGYTRNEDGSINLNGFLELNSNAPSNAGADLSKFTAMTPPELVPDLEHNLGDWTSDDPYVHWIECECGFKANLGEHEFEYVIDKEPTATTPGYKHNECKICGLKKAQIEIPALGGAACDEHVDRNNDGFCDICDEEVEIPDDSQPGEPGESTPPSIFEDFASFWAWLWNEIVKFFSSLFA